MVNTIYYIDIYSGKKAKYGAKTSHSHGNFSAKAKDLFRYRDSTKKCPAKGRHNVSKRRLFLKKRGVSNGRLDALLNSGQILSRKTYAVVT